MFEGFTLRYGFAPETESNMASLDVKICNSDFTRESALSVEFSCDIIFTFVSKRFLLEIYSKALEFLISGNIAAELSIYKTGSLIKL